MAAELSDGHVKETDIQLTPSGGGRFEIYVNGEKVYDRLAPGEKDFYPSLRSQREARKKLVAAIDAADKEGVGAAARH